MLQPGLIVIHANHLETLTEITVQWLRDHPLAPLEDECFLVQSNGMAQWLKQRLAADDACGVCAAQRFRMPASFLWQAYRSVLGAGSVPASSPFEKSRLVWRLMALLPELLPRKSFTPLRLFLAGDDDQGRRYQLACKLADLLDQYQVYRADWLENWEQGTDSVTSLRGETSPLPVEQRWQAELWRKLVASLPQERRRSSRAHVHQAFVTALARSTAHTHLPRRLIVFGITSMPRQMLDALQALSRHCQILMLVQNPCRHYWADIVEERTRLRGLQRHGQKPGSVMDGSFPAQAHGHPLLAAWGKQGRDYIAMLYDYDVPEAYRHWFSQIDAFLPVSEFHRRPDSILARVQQAVLDLDPLPVTPLRVAPDSSIRFHVAHSPQREIEVLHDQLLATFEAAAASRDVLRPRDVIVMVPDIEAYTPHIEAVFGNASGERAIPYTISDRNQRHRQPLAVALEALLNLPHSRVAVGEVLDLLDVAALRARFGIAAVDLPQLRQWVRESGIRWGLHAAQRGSLDLPMDIEQNSWVFGLQRMLLGYVTGEGNWREIEAYGDVSGLQAALAGQLADLLRHLENLWRSLRQPATPVEWGVRLRSVLDDFFLPESDADLQLRMTLLEALEDWLQACEEADFDQPLPLSVVREAWLGALDRGGLQQRFLAGRVNFCTLMPMRSIPFRLVCLLGMNDGDYPRSQLPLDFDLMAQPRQFRPGDRSRRDDDRYLFLEALLAAREALYISWVGRDIRDNHERPPSVLVAQLRDYLAAMFDDGSTDLLTSLTVHHPLQPFSPRYFDSTDARLFSYDDEWRAAHDGGTGVEPRTLPPLAEGEPIRLGAAQLGRFLRDPVQLFFEQRLLVRYAPDELYQDNDEPFALGNLARSATENRVLQAMLRAGPERFEDALAMERAALLRSGDLPLGRAGLLELDACCDSARNTAAAWRKLDAAFPAPAAVREIALTLEIRGHRFEFEDWLDQLRGHGGTLLRLGVLAGQLKGKPQRLLDAWSRHLLASASGIDLQTAVIGPDIAVTLAPLTPEGALEHLQAIAQAWLAALDGPLPLACRTGFALLQAGDKGWNKARERYDGSGFSPVPGEVDFSGNAALKRAYPDFVSLTEPRHGDQAAFEYWARALYRPLLAHMQEAAHE